ncbi:MAG: efflux transporter outer membrane subunit [Chthoniobacteraceae bacterium]|nr:efflux transporter outer membrane subunit [Chthoniobacteraceae bacterium]
MYKRPLSLALSVVTLAGCTMIPKYHRPDAPIAKDWPTGAAYGKTDRDGAAADIAWRSFFTDPQIQKVIELALQNNRDLRVAALNVELARDQYRIQRASLYPSIDASAGGVRGRTAAGVNGSAQAALGNQYNVGLAATAYEVDLFGRLRSLTRQEQEKYLASAEARTSVQISLIAQVAVGCLTLREIDEQLAVAHETLKAVQDSYQLNKRSFEAGTASELDLSTADAQVQTARVHVLEFERQSAVAANALTLLVGQPVPADLLRGRPLESRSVLASLPAGLPSDLLLRRPDILANEHILKAANANIGAARADFFPTISLTSSLGASSLQLSKLFERPGSVWAFAPQASLPIFDAGRNLAALDASKVNKRIEVANYEKAIQTAFREVADALADKASYERQVGAQETLVDAESKRYTLANARYRQGVDNYLNVLSAQQDLYNAQQGLIQARFARLSSLVMLYKSLGGGWK